MTSANLAAYSSELRKPSVSNMFNLMTFDFLTSNRPQVASDTGNLSAKFGISISFRSRFRGMCLRQMDIHTDGRTDRDRECKLLNGLQMKNKFVHHWTSCSKPECLEQTVRSNRTPQTKEPHILKAIFHPQKGIVKQQKVIEK